MRISELLESEVGGLIPPKVWSRQLGKAAALAARDVQEKYNSIQKVYVSSYQPYGDSGGGYVQVMFEMYAGSSVGVAALFKKRLKEVRLPPYTSKDKTNFGDTHLYEFSFPHFRAQEYVQSAFEEGWGEVDGISDVSMKAKLV
jgi:hypothetical protein